MNLAAATSVMSPADAFIAASTRYEKALDALTFPANARVDVRSAIGVALTQANEAVSYLTPFVADTSDMFTRRNATASIESAKTAITALDNAIATLAYTGPAGPQIPVSTFLEVAQKNIKHADDALYWE